MDTLFEQKIVQNTALSAEIIYHTVSECFSSSNRVYGPRFAAAFLILPICYHADTCKSINGKQQPGILYKALAENRELPIGLQKRVEGMANRTLKALNLAFSSNMIRYYLEADGTLLPGENRYTSAHSAPEIKTIINSAKRLGRIFTEVDFPQLCSLLNVRF